MGIDFDPDGRDVEHGVSCGAWEAQPGRLYTPKYVLVTFSGIGQCFIAPGPAPNGSFVLTQMPANPCQWYADSGGCGISFGYGVGIIQLGCSQAPGFWFTKTYIDGSKLTFENAYVCGPITTYGEGGIGLINWGPDIGV